MRRSLALSLLLLTLLAGWLAVQARSAQQDLTAARSEIAVARQALSEQDLSAAEASVDRGGRQTQDAVEATSGRLWRLSARLPLLGRPLVAVAELAGTADDVVRRVLPAAVGTARSADPNRLREPSGTIDVARLQAAQAPSRTALARAQEAQERARAVPATSIGRIDTARDELRSEITRLTEVLDAAARALQIAPALLGADRERRYFVLVQQTAESRGTGGLPGGFAVITAARGRLTITAQGSNAGLQRFTVEPPASVPSDYIARYASLGAFDTVVNVNVSPDLPVVARVLAARWRVQTGEQIDGVVAVDALGLAAVLRGSGPLQLPGGRSVAPEALPDYLAIGQYRDFAPRRSADGIDRSQARKDALDDVALAAARRLSRGDGDTGSLVRGLVDAVQSGHLRMASDDPALAPGLRASGVDGALPVGAAPVAYPVVFNSSGGKLDTFLDRSVSYASGGCVAGRRATRISVRLTSRPPASGLPPYVTTSLRDGTARQSLVNRLTLAVYATRGAVLGKASLDGRPLAPGDLVGGTEAGLSVWSTLLDLRPNAPRVLTLELDEPLVAGAPRLPEQALARPLQRELRWSACPAGRD